MRIDGACHCGRLGYEADVDPESGTRPYASAEKDPQVFNLGDVKPHAKQSM